MTARLRAAACAALLVTSVGCDSAVVVVTPTSVSAGTPATIVLVVRTAPDSSYLIVTATVRDDAGEPVPAYPVAFETPAGMFRPAVAPTDASGVVETVFNCYEQTTITARAGHVSQTIGVVPISPAASTLPAPTVSMPTPTPIPNPVPIPTTTSTPPPATPSIPVPSLPR